MRVTVPGVGVKVLLSGVVAAAVVLWAVGALSAEYWELPGVGVKVLLSGVVAAAVVLGTVGALSAECSSDSYLALV